MLKSEETNLTITVTRNMHTFLKTQAALRQTTVRELVTSAISEKFRFSEDEGEKLHVVK